MRQALRRLVMRGQHGRRAGGFTYLSVIIVVAIIGLVAASALKLGAVVQRSRAEQELLYIGAAFSDALQSYADATPAGMPPQPPSLKELLRDPRFPVVRRHLRKVFVDPITGGAEWGVVYSGDKIGVLAVYSLSDARPVKVGNFPARFDALAGKQKLSEWRFGAVGKSAAAQGAPPPVSTPTTPGKPLPPAGTPTPTPMPAPEPVPELQPALPPLQPPPEPELSTQ